MEVKNGKQRGAYRAEAGQGIAYGSGQPLERLHGQYGTGKKRQSVDQPPQHHGSPWRAPAGTAKEQQPAEKSHRAGENHTGSRGIATALRRHFIKKALQAEQ